MKPILNILPLVPFLLAVAAGCSVADDASSGPDLSDDGIYGIVDTRAVTPLRRVVELADFYSRYRLVWDDGEALESLKNVYFGETVSLAADGVGGVDVDYWGSVSETDTDDCWVAVLSSHWTGYELSFDVTANGARSYSIVYDSALNDRLTGAEGYSVSLSADVTVSGDVFEVSGLDLLYATSVSGGEVEVRVSSGSGDEAVTIGLCRDGEFAVYPVGGVLYYAASGAVSANFRVVFYGDYCEVIGNEILDTALSF